MFYTGDILGVLDPYKNLPALAVILGLDPTLEPGLQVMIACGYTFKPLIDLVISAWKKSSDAISQSNVLTIGRARQRPNQSESFDEPSLGSQYLR